MGDYPLDELGGRTPLQAARIPTIRSLAAAGRTYMVRTAPDNMYPGSDVANLSLLGYDPREHYTGRAPIEAAGSGLSMQADDVAFRCNLVTISDEHMQDYSAGHISSEEGRLLIETIQQSLGRDGLVFHPGVGYRHLLLWRDGPAQVTCTPPHDIAEKPIAQYLPHGPRSDELLQLMNASRRILAEHPVNQRRRVEGKPPATQIWLWGQGRTMHLPSYNDLYGLTGGVVSAVDLVRGLGILAGLKADRIAGATGFLDTDFDAKVQAALDILSTDDFVFVHLEAPDECGHIGDAALKVRAIEAFDERIVKPVWDALQKQHEPFRLILCTDHRTPVSVRGHTPEPVPMCVVSGPLAEMPADAAPFDESLPTPDSVPLAFEIVRQVLSSAQRTKK